MNLENMLMEMVKLLPEEAKKTLVSVMLNSSLALNKAEKDIMYHQDAIYDGDVLSQENYRNQVLADLKNGVHSEKVKEMVERYYLILEKAEELKPIISADGKRIEKVILKDNYSFGIKDSNNIIETVKNGKILKDDFDLLNGRAEYIKTFNTDSEFINSIFDTIVETINIKQNGDGLLKILELYTKIDERHKDYRAFYNNSEFIKELHNFKIFTLRLDKIRNTELKKYYNIGYNSTTTHNGFIVLKYDVKLVNSEIL
jgi:hypothetical protein